MGRGNSPLIFIFMPFSYSYFKKEFKEHLYANFNTNIEILDVGAGCGTYGDLLKQDFTNIDGIEIFEPYKDQFDLDKIYRHLYIGDIKDLNIFLYNYIIMGDVIEHMSVEDAQALLEKIYQNNIYCMVAIPYIMPQGDVGGNEYERHLQDDLTHELFIERYPMMQLLIRNEHYGYYVNYNYEYTF